MQPDIYAFRVETTSRCTGWPKQVSHYQMIKNRVKSC